MRIRTSLRRRVAVAGFVLIAVLVLALDAFVYLSLRERLESDLDRLLASRAQFAVGLANEVEPWLLGERLARVGIRAEILPVQGAIHLAEPAATYHGFLPPPGTMVAQSDGSFVGRSASLPDGSTVIVYASRDGLDTTLGRVLLFQAVGTAGILIAAALVLTRLTGLALRPLEGIATTAHRIVDGDTNERLQVEVADPDLRRMSLAFNRMLDALAAAVEESREAEATTKRFLTDAAHQLRTPVAALRASAEALSREGSVDERERLLDNLLRESARTSTLVDNLLRIARLDRSDPVVRAPIDLVRLVVREVERCAALVPRLRVECEVISAPGGSLELDESLVGGAIGNLLENAARHAASRIDVRVETTRRWVDVRIRDDGSGLPPGAEKDAFERFVTLDGAGGSGLGLPIARAVARAHGGDLLYLDGEFILRLALPESGPPAEVGEHSGPEITAEEEALQREGSPA